jgi:hypothetical protein
MLLMIVAIMMSCASEEKGSPEADGGSDISQVERSGNGGDVFAKIEEQLLAAQAVHIKFNMSSHGAVISHLQAGWTSSNDTKSLNLERRLTPINFDY